MKRVHCNITKTMRLLSATACLLGGGGDVWAQTVTPEAVTPGGVEPALRDLWPGYLAPRHLRQWQVAGPLSAPLAPGQLASASWRPYEAYGDRFEIANAAGAAAYRPSDEPEYVYTRTTLDSAQGERKALVVDTPAPVRAWLNGQPISAAAGAYDLVLKPGTNDLLIEYRHAQTPVETAVTLAGADEPVQNVAAPRLHLSRTADGIVLTLPDASPPGGAYRIERISAALPPKVWTAASGSELRLDIATWPDGPYAFRLLSDPSDEGVAVADSVQWYKGNAGKDAKALLALEGSGFAAVPAAYAAWLRRRLHASIDSGLPLGAGDDRLSAILLEYAAARDDKATATGFVRLAYADPVDGSTQFCRVYLPTDYTSRDQWPAVVSLHGFNPDNPDYDNWWSADAIYNPSADRYGVIWIEPHGRGNAQYMGIGEADVLRCMSLAREKLHIDPNRTYLTGESMGGAGTWLIGSRHPDLFAAIAPNFGGWDFRVAGSYGMDLSHARSDWLSEKFFMDIQSSFQGAEALLNVPVFVNHGDSDPAMPTDYSRHAVKMLQRWGYDVRYWEHPGGKHSNLNQYDVVIPWLLRHQRVEHPAEVRIRSRDLAGATAYWLSVTAAETPFAMIRVEARLEDKGLIRINTANVASLVLSPPKDFLDPQDHLMVIWNDQAADAVPDGSGRFRLGPDDGGALRKHAGLEGGLSSVIATPFMLVVGTRSPDPAMNRMMVDKAEIFAALWREWQHTPVRIKRDTEVDADDMQRYSLLLLGGPGENAVAQAWSSRLPYGVEPDRISVGGKAFETMDAVLQLVYPSPANPDRYAFVVAPTSVAGMYFWNAGGLWQRPFGTPLLNFDWTIQDGLRVNPPSGVGAERSFVASGVFDAAWQVRDEFFFAGDTAVRDKGERRSPPAPQASQFDPADYAGSYEIVPGFSLTVAEQAGQLTVTAPLAPPVTLIPERHDEFGARESGASYVFCRDASGRVTGVEIFGTAPKVVAKRVG